MTSVIGSMQKVYIEKLAIRGIVHIGANTCQELSLYTKTYQIPESQVVWVEAIPHLVQQLKSRGIKNVYQAVLDKTAGEVEFNVTNNNGESSSILNLKTHLDRYPNIRVNNKLTLKTETLSTFISNNAIPENCLDFLVLDIQGAELRVLSGSPEVLKNVKMICTEICVEELYEGYGLFKDLNLFMESCGFVCVAKEINSQNWGDALYIRKELV
jgi:FkbM family methyltransferase